MQAHAWAMDLPSKTAIAYKYLNKFVITYETNFFSLMLNSVLCVELIVRYHVLTMSVKLENVYFLYHK